MIIKFGLLYGLGRGLGRMRDLNKDPESRGHSVLVFHRKSVDLGHAPYWT
jgi:hypothetical protein